MSYSEDLVLTLRQARKKAGLNQRMLAKKIGVPQSHISKIESGKIKPTITSIIAIGRVLGFEIMAVPKQYVAAVKSLSQNNNQQKQQPAYSLDDEDEND